MTPTSVGDSLFRDQLVERRDRSVAAMPHAGDLNGVRHLLRHVDAALSRLRLARLASARRVMSPSRPTGLPPIR